METDSSTKQDPHSRLKSYTVLYSYSSSPAPPLRGGDISNPSPLALYSNIHFYTRRAVEGSPRRVEKLIQRSKGEGYHNKKFWGLLHFEFRNSSAPPPPNPLPPVEGECLPKRCIKRRQVRCKSSANQQDLIIIHMNADSTKSVFYKKAGWPRLRAVRC